MLENFIKSLEVMGLGMGGVFAVTIILMLVMYALNKLFPPKKDEE